ncbi:83beaea8-4099-4955-a3a0-4cdd764150b5 [Thermothielavioides terrestris]|uniref:83beaea8-4099-4955-a3a0-4cdd764150b5 n=1 Tax=Thermothielavioides terrestris TaxID=2587410 RepID=A0A3S4B7Q4_9PEZI|nr:83beaea8-4099-4955-a3a0-4cdd764150b5 [Thermothielavioides terrestris]
MSKPGFEDIDFGAPPPKQHQIHTPPDSPEKTTHPMVDFPTQHRKTDSLSKSNVTTRSRQDSRGQRRRTSLGDLEGNLTIPTSPTSYNTIEVPALRPLDADSTQFMHNLSASPSMKARRVSRNSFGVTLPIPRSKRQSRLSGVTFPAEDQAASRAGKQSEGAQVQPSREILTSQVQDVHADKVKAAKNMAFVFDIDGVLVHGDRLIPQARRALEMLNGDNQLGLKIPHIFLTNGSGKPEKARTEQLARILQNPVSTDQFIQSHTPMRALAEYYNTVLVVGGEGYRCREVAEEYGFKDIVVPNDILAWESTIAPYRVFTEEERASSLPRDFARVNIDAILVFSDSRDYATDMQIIIDLLRSKMLEPLRRLRKMKLSRYK